MRINFDANASTRPIPEVLQCLADYRGEFLNPSSVHALGQAAKMVLDETRSEIRETLNLRESDKIIFTSGATEANNAALNFNFGSDSIKETLAACTNIEHASVLEFLRHYSRQKFQFLELPTESLLNREYLATQINDNLKLFAVMLANNESGQILDLPKISHTIKSISPRARIHCDAVQALGKIKINFHSLGADTLSISGHKIGSLSGVGALVISEFSHLDPWLLGGPQEFGLRAGTENVLAIKTLGIACRAARKNFTQRAATMAATKQKIDAFLNEFGSQVVVHRFSSETLPNTLSVRFPGLKADDLVVALDLCGVSISAGSACASGRPNPSHVLLASGLSEREAKETVRISFEPEVQDSELTYAIEQFKQILIRMQTSRRAA